MGYTLNGAITNDSTGKLALDLFAGIGSARNFPSRMTDLFSLVWEQSPALALRILMWARDIRGGAGEREIFRRCVKVLAHKESYAAQAALEAMITRGKFEELGRWDDLLCLIDAQPDLCHIAAQHIKKALVRGDGLCAKWMPRKGPEAAKLRRLLKMTPREYRKTLVSLTNVVEQKMCANEWSEIQYDKLTGMNVARYSRAFAEHDEVRWEEFLAKLKEGKAKAKTKVLFPHEVLRVLKSGETELAETLWRELADTLEGAQNILPVIDTSGSMEQPVSGGIRAMDVAIALGIYAAERQEGAFKNLAVTFSEKPAFFNITKAGDTFVAKVATVRRQNWGYNTDFQKVFDEILRIAREENVRDEDMPEYVLVISDMEFDAAKGGIPNTLTNFETIKACFAAEGRKMPKLVFWNVAARVGNQPATKDDYVSLISGFSPSILTKVFKHKEVSPVELMWEVVGVERYSLAGFTDQ